MFQSKYIILKVKDEASPPKTFEMESFHIYETYSEAVEQLLFTRRYRQQSQVYYKIIHGVMIELVFGEDRYVIVEMMA